MAVPTSVEEYLAGIPDGSRAALEELRETIKAAAPEATETISYQMPAFKDHGRFLVSYAAYKDHCSLFPASDAVRDACGDELQPYFSGKGTIRFEADKPLPAALVEKIVKVRLEENAAVRRP
ncbi:MAG: iron chaperone [Actinomycetota bacterium]